MKNEKVDKLNAYEFNLFILATLFIKDNKIEFKVK